MKFQISNFKSQIFKNWLIILILALASFMRLYRVADYMTFLGDEGRDVLVVYGILHGKLTLLGPTASVGGFFLGPVYYYFMAPFLWLFNYNPVGPAVMVALFGIATVWLLYKFGSEIFGRKVGLISSFLYAISPVVIAYSRSSWNPNVVPFFSLLTLYVLYKALKKHKALLFLISGILYGILMQLHYVVTFLGVIIVVYVAVNILVQSKNFSNKILQVFKNYLIIFIGFIIGWSPFLAFEVRHGFPNIKSILNFVFTSGDTGGSGNYFGIIYNVFFRLFARLTAAYPAPEQISNFNKTLILFWYLIILAIATFATVTLILKTFSSLKKNKDDFLKYSLLFIWFFGGIIIFGFYKKSIYDYYFGFMFPLPFLLLGISFSFIQKKFKKGVWITGFLVLILAAVNLQGIPFRYQPNHQLNQVETISKFVVNKTNNKPFNFALIAAGNSDHAYRYFFTLWGKEPIAIQNKQIDPQRKTATDQLLIVCESFPCQPLGNSLWEIAGFGQAEIAGEWDVSVVKVFKLIHHKGK